MDLFHKCFEFTTAHEAQAMGLYPYFHCMESGQDPVVICEGREMIMAGSNNYLGLTSHPSLKDRAIQAIETYGVGCVGSRFLNGTSTFHIELENRLAAFQKRQAALVFSTGMQTNLGTISALVGKDDVVITDKYDHASILDACRLSAGEMQRFRHNDTKDLERVLRRIPEQKAKLVVVDGVYSMEGDLADLPAIAPLARTYGARLMVDDAHGMGVLGANGRGTCEHFGLEDQVDIVMGTFSKSFACVGGFVAGDEAIIHYLKHHARALIFSASLPPSNVASVLAALDIIEGEPDRRKRLLENAEYLRQGFKRLQFNTGESATQVIPVILGGGMNTVLRAWRILFDLGVFTTPILSPAVPENRCLIRVAVMATHTQTHLDRILEAFATVSGILKFSTH